MASKKAIHFDLNTQDLKLYYNEKNPNYAYKVIEDFFLDHGFEHIQYSGYHSIKGMTFANVMEVMEQLQEKCPWLGDCVRSFTVTSIGKTYEIKEVFRKASDEDQLNIEEETYEMEFY